MTAIRTTAPRLAAGLAAVVGPLLVLTFGWESQPLLPIASIVAVSAAAIALRASGLGAARVASALALVAGVGIVAATAAVDPVSEILVGGAGLGVLFWVGVGEESSRDVTAVASGLVLPALALGIAIAVGALLPVARQSVGIAGLLLVVAVGVLGWALFRVAPGPLSEAAPPSL